MNHFQPFFTQLDQYLAARMRQVRTPGMALALFDRNETLYSATYGVTHLESQAAVTKHTLFEIGSITKTFTAVAILQCVARSQIDLDAPITDYLPWFSVPSNFEPIRVRHLLNHTGGLVGAIDRSPDIRGSVYALRQTAAVTAPGTVFSYSDAGYQILTLILERVVGQPFAEIIRQQIFTPLGMHHSHATITSAIRPQMATGYRSLYDDRPLHSSHPLVPATWFEVRSGDCSIVSTAEDMAKFARMLLTEGKSADAEILAVADWQVLMSGHIDGGWCKYGYGTMQRSYKGTVYNGHGGGMPGYIAEMLLDLDTGIGVVVLCTEPYLRLLSMQTAHLWRSAYLGNPISPEEWAIPELTDVLNAAEYAGNYRSNDDSFELRAEGTSLSLVHQTGSTVLERSGSSNFLANLPRFDRYLLEPHHSEVENEQSVLTGLWWGGEFFAKAGHSVPTSTEAPANWHAFCGHYRSHNPFQTNFRIVLRHDQLWLIRPAGDGNPLFALGEAEFAVGDARSPDRVRFDQIVDQQALRATFSATDYYRFFVE